jgi:hypothetical protein
VGSFGHAFLRLACEDYVNRVQDAGDKAKQREDNVQPKMQPKSHFEKHAYWRKENGKQNLDWVGQFDASTRSHDVYSVY